MPEDKKILPILYKPIINSLNFCLDLINGEYKFAYILACWNDGDQEYTFYTGQTNNIFRRFGDHQNGSTSGDFQNKKLVYLEIHHPDFNILAREREISELSFEKKLNLIKSLNPEFQQFINNMNEILVKKRLKKETKPSETSEISDLVQSEIVIPLDINEAPKWFREYYLTNQGDLLAAEIIEKWIKASNQRRIAFKKDIGLTRVNKILKRYREGNNLPNDDLRLSTAFEYWICHCIGAKRDGGFSRPSLWITHSELLYPGECKLIYDRSKSITLYITSSDVSNKALKPSYEYCKKHNIPRFPLFFRNPQWGDFDMLIPIEISGNNKITIYKSQINTYIKSFSEFNQNKFFEINNKK